MKTMKTALSALTLALIASGCTGTEPKPVVATCDAPASKNVERAFEISRDNLSSRSCWSRHDEHFQALLDITAGDPGSQNKQRFAEWLDWSESTGIISKRQKQKAYTQYFTPMFVSLPRDASNCRVGKDLESFTRNLDAEVLEKRKGLVGSLGDTGAFNKAKRDRDAIVLVVAAAAEACVAQGR